jgi:hypothetical protein
VEVPEIRSTRDRPACALASVQKSKVNSLCRQRTSRAAWNNVRPLPFDDGHSRCSTRRTTPVNAALATTLPRRSATGASRSPRSGGWTISTGLRTTSGGSSPVHDLGSQIPRPHSPVPANPVHAATPLLPGTRPILPKCFRASSLARGHGTDRGPGTSMSARHAESLLARSTSLVSLR